MSIPTPTAEPSTPLQEPHDAIAPPLNVLRRPQRDIKGLLLQSIYRSHADVLRFDSISSFQRDEHEVVEGEFVHLPTGRRYSLQIVELPESSHV